MGNRSEHIASWAVVTYAQNILRQTVSVGVKTLRNVYTFGSFKACQKGKASHQVERRYSKKSLLELPNSFPLKYLNE